MIRTTCRTQLNPSRFLALCLACVCLWMGTVGAAGHTDILRVDGASAQAGVHHAAVPLPADACAACQWIQGALSFLPATVLPAAPLLTLVPLHIAVFASPCLPAPRCRSPRAPPLDCFC